MGVAAIQMAKAIGAKSIAVTRSEAKKEPLLGAGADEVIVAGNEDVQEMILELTEGLGAEVIYDAVAGPGLEEMFGRQREPAMSSFTETLGQWNTGHCCLSAHAS
jgi:NADPH:quinone reductase-like Zn-dependent oxidoreductase